MSAIGIGKRGGKRDGAGRPHVKPTVQQIHDAHEYAKTGLSEARIVAAVGIADKTYRDNREKPHWEEFRREIRRGVAEGAALVAGADFKDALDMKSPMRSQARDRHLKRTRELVERFEVTGKDGTPLASGPATRLIPVPKAIDVRRALEIYSRSTKNKRHGKPE